MPTTSSRPVPRQRKFDHGVALELALQGWRNSEIAKRYGVHETSVKQALAKYNHLLNDLGPGAIQAYRQHRSELFTVAERELVASLLDPAAISKASLNNRAYAFQQIHTARRLEEDKSTANTQGLLHVLVEQAHAQLFKSKPNKVVSTPNHTPNSQDTETSETDDTTPATTPPER